MKRYKNQKNLLVSGMYKLKKILNPSTEKLINFFCILNQLFAYTLVLFDFAVFAYIERYKFASSYGSIQNIQNKL